MRYHKLANFHHTKMKLLVLLFSLSVIQCVYGLGMDKFNAKLKSGKTTFKCSFQFELSEWEVSSAKVQCTPRNKKAQFNNLKLKGNLAEYLISFRLKPTKILKVATIPPCPLGFTQVCTPHQGGCRYGMEEYCPDGEESHARKAREGMKEEGSCIPDIVVE